jgi:hypothetical protein
MYMYRYIYKHYGRCVRTSIYCTSICIYKKLAHISFPNKISSVGQLHVKEKFEFDIFL